MKKFLLLLAVAHFGIGLARNSEVSPYNFNNGFIFVERGITFSVYPDGEFDFYMNQNAGLNAQLQVGPVGVTFNSGFDYGAYVQYDDFGAVIQIENVPIYYDYYGRVSRIGNVGIWYRNNMLYRIGGMRIFYNPMGVYAYHTGFINVFNRHYVFNPFHNYFVRPIGTFRLVSRNPYRRTYRPTRYRFFTPYRNNHRRTYAQVGRASKHEVRRERDRLYLNNARISQRSSTSAARNTNTGRIEGRNTTSQRGTIRTNSNRPNANGFSGTVRSTVVERASRPAPLRNNAGTRSSSASRSSNSRSPIISRNAYTGNQKRAAAPTRSQQSSTGRRPVMQQQRTTQRAAKVSRTATQNRRSTSNTNSRVSRRSGDN